MIKVDYKNRYGEIFTFTKISRYEILWEGPFKYTRCAYDNDYKDAFQRYVKDGGELELDMFIEEIHRSIFSGDTGKYIGPSEISRKYSSLVSVDFNSLYMVDPSGGPYIGKGSEMKNISKKFRNKIVQSIQPCQGGYLLKVT